MGFMWKYLVVVFISYTLFATSLGAEQNTSRSDAWKQDIYTQTDLDAIIELVSLMSSTVHILQQERGASTGFIASGGKKFQRKLEKIKTESDQAKQNLLVFLNINYNLLQKYFSAEDRDGLNTLFNELFVLRQDVAHLQIDFAKTYSKYTQVIAYLLLEISNVSDRLEKKELVDALYAYSTLLMYKESLGQKRAALSGLFSQTKYAKEIFEYFLTADTQEQIYLKNFLHIADAATKNYYYKIRDKELNEKVKKYEKLALQKMQGTDIEVNPELWFDVITQKINNINKVQEKLLEAIKELVHKFRNDFWLQLTQKEKDWLSKKQSITYAYDPNWKPFEYKNGISQHVGIIADILKIIQNKTGITFVPSHSPTWEEAYEKIITKKVDMISAMGENEQRKKFVDFTKNIIFTIPNVFVSTQENDFSNGFGSLGKKKLALVKGYAIESVLKNDKPEVDYVRVNTVTDGLKDLTNGKIDVLLLNLATAEYFLNQQEYKNLKIAYRTDYTFDLKIALKKGFAPEALSIIDKALGTISEKQRNDIYKKWFHDVDKSIHKPENKVDTISLFDILPLKEIAVTSFIFIVFVLFMLKYLRNKSEINIGIPVFIFVFVFLLMTVLVMIVSFSNLERVKKEELKNSLVTISNSTHIALQEWYFNKKDSIDYIVKNSLNFQDIQNLVQHKEDVKYLLHHQEALDKYYKKIKNSFKDRVSYFLVSKDNYLLGASTKEIVGEKFTLPFVIKEIQHAFDGNYAFIHPKIDPSDKYELFRKLYFLTPVYNEKSGKVIAVYATGVEPMGMIKIMQEGWLGKTGETYVINRRAQLISNSRFDEGLRKLGLLKKDQHSFLNLKIQHNGKLTLAAKSVLEEKTGYSLEAYPDYRGIDVFGAWLWDEKLHFGIITEIDKQEAMDSFERLKNTIYLTVFSIVGFVILLMIFIVWFANRNKKILEQKNKQLQEFSNSLEQKVQERTLELEESMERFSTIFESSPDSISIIDAKGFYVDCNKATVEIFGLRDKKDFIGTTPKLYSPLKQPNGEFTEVLVKQRVSRVFDVGIERFEWVHQRIDTGELFDAEVILAAITLKGEPHMYAVVRDITQRKRLENTIKQNNHHMTFISEKANLIFWKLNPRVGDLFVNDVFVNILGYDPKKIFKEGSENDMFKPFKEGLEFWVDLLHPDDIAHTTKALHDHLEGKTELYKVDYRMKRADGSWMYSTAIGKIVEYDEHNRPTRMNGVNIDIDEQKKAQKELEILGQLVYGSLESASVGAWWVDFTEEDTFHALETTAKMIGIEFEEGTKDSLKISAWGKVLEYTATLNSEYKEAIESTFEKFNGAISGKYESYHAMYPIAYSDGSVKWIEARADVTKRDANNQALFMAGTLIDITDAREAKKRVDILNKNMRDSIEYASLIQHSLIPEESIFPKYFQDSFAIWQPKDIVGGDIYLMEEISEDEVLLMVIDCTGHGVPGAFVTMLVKAIERQILANIYNNEGKSPAKMLQTFNQGIKLLLKQENDDAISNAGFDGAIIYYNKKEKIFKYAGTNTPLYYYRDGEIEVIKGDRHSIGYKKSDANYEFKEYDIEIQEGMSFYITTDGYLDQNGGEKGFPLGKKRFKKIITESCEKTFKEQKEIFIQTLYEYQGDEERNDDVTLVGFKI